MLKRRERTVDFVYFVIDDLNLAGNVVADALHPVVDILHVTADILYHTLDALDLGSNIVHVIADILNIATDVWHTIANILYLPLNSPHSIIDAHNFAIDDSMRHLQQFRRCHPYLFLSQLVQFVQAILDVCVSRQRLQKPF